MAPIEDNAQRRLGVVRQPGQFSFVRKGAIPAANRGTQAWRNAVAVAHIAHEEQWQTEAEDALASLPTVFRKALERGLAA